MKHTSIVLGLSIAALPILVNGQTQTHPKAISPKSDLKDSVKDGAVTLRRLMEKVFKVGKKGRFGKNSAIALGLDGETPSKNVELAVPNEKGGTRGCYVAYEGERPICTYIVRYFRSGGDTQSQYYRVTPDGKLERALVLSGKRDSDGKVVKGSAAQVEQDVNSPEVQKAFEAESDYWLKDWLTKKASATPKKAAQSAAAL